MLEHVKGNVVTNGRIVGCVLGKQCAILGLLVHEQMWNNGGRLNTVGACMSEETIL